jgi:excisionase family DNA binding protein
MNNGNTALTTVSPGDPLLTIPEATQYMRLGKTKVRELIKDGELPAVKYHRRVLIRQSAVDNYISRHTCRTHSRDSEGEE